MPFAALAAKLARLQSSARTIHRVRDRSVTKVEAALAQSCEVAHESA
jgi:hypothetical protein